MLRRRYGATAAACDSWNDVFVQIGGVAMNKFFLRLLGMSRPRKRALQVVVDVVILTGVFGTAMWLRLEKTEFAVDPMVWAALLPVVPISILLFVRMGFYRAVVRYIASRALVIIMLGSVLSGFILSLTITIAGLPVPRSVPIIYSILTFMAIGGVRFGFRELLLLSQDRHRERVAIYGAGATGRQVMQLLRQGTAYLPVAFLDDSVSAQGTHVGGIRVHAPERIDTLIRDNAISSVLLAIPSATKSRRREILKSLEKFSVQRLTVPDLSELVTGTASVNDIHEVSIEELLGRDIVEPNSALLSANIRDKVVMVTGAGGSIGSELCHQILRQSPSQLILFELSEIALYSIEQNLVALQRAEGYASRIHPVLGSVQSAARVEQTMRTFGVQTVYHAAAFKHVPLVEHNVTEGIRNNLFGTRIVAEAAIAAGVESFILISTDKAVRPTNVMGASKRLAELVCQALARSHRGSTVLSMVRFGNVLGSSGSVIPLFRRQIEAGGPMTVTHPDITRYFITITEAAQLVIQAGAMARGGEVFVLDMGLPVRIAELAAQMARLHGLKPVLVPENHAEKLAPGEIGIVFTRLRPGEKLFEELLIGNSPEPSAHPYIKSATERFMPMNELSGILERLEQACDSSDIAAIRTVLEDAQIGYLPSSDIVDQIWLQENQGPDIPLDRRVANDSRHLSLVR